MSKAMTEALDKAEDHFWEVLYEQMSDRISEHIAEHRDVTNVTYDKHASLDDYMKTDSDLQNGKVYRDQVSFSAYSYDWHDNLDEVAVEGRIQLQTKYQDFFGGMSADVREDYKSEILTNPTWLDLCLCANDMIHVTGDNHHIFLEAVHKTGQFTLDDKSFVLIYDFSMGS